MESGECFTPQLQEHRGKLRINTALITPQNGVNQKRSCSYTLFKKWIRHFYWPSRGGTKQLKADTVVLAKTWQEAPHRAAEMFPGENPAPNTCTSLPPRQPLKTKWQVHDSRGKSLFLYSKLKPMLPCCLLFFFFNSLQSPHSWPWILVSSISFHSSLKPGDPVLSNSNHIQQPIKNVTICMQKSNAYL